MRPEYRDRVAILAQRLGGLVEDYEASAREGARRLPWRSRWAVLTAAGIYGDIAREVVRRGPRAWDGRVVTSRWAKLRWVARSWAEARR
jgi:phytoene synthase